MKEQLLIAALALACSITACADEGIQFPASLENLAARAKETVDVTLDSSMLHLASAFLSKDDKDQAQIKKLTSNLKGIYVRSYEFDRDGQYSMRDLDLIRSQLKRPEWSRIVNVKESHGASQHENTEIYVKKNGDQIGGLVVLDAEPKELTIVDIEGPINPEDLSRLSGHMGIPKIGHEPVKPKAKSGSTGEEQ